MKVIFIIVSTLLYVAANANPVIDEVEGILDTGTHDREGILDTGTHDREGILYTEQDEREGFPEIGYYPWVGMIDTGRDARDAILDDGVKVFEHVGILDDGTAPWGGSLE